MISDNVFLGSVTGAAAADTDNAIDANATTQTGIVTGNICRHKAAVTNLADDGVDTIVQHNYNSNALG